jgi:hypothetical protein
MKGRRQPPRAAGDHGRGWLCVVGMGQVMLQEGAQRLGGFLFLRAADLQRTGIAAAGGAGHQLQHAFAVGAAAVAQVAENDGGGEAQAGLLQQAGRAGMQAVGQREGERDGGHGRGALIFPGGRTRPRGA